VEANTLEAKLPARYQFQSLLGEGGYATVYCAWDAQLDRTVAIKRLRPSAENADKAGKAWQEAMRLAPLHHPNIVAIYDFGSDEEGPYVVMEFVQGETLEEIVGRAVLTLDDFSCVARQTLDAMVAAHHTGIIHRDLTGRNIMVTWLPSGAYQVKILDFGLARFATDPSQQTPEDEGSVTGSIYFMAPEMINNGVVDTRSDLYSLGCVFYHALAGAMPFAGETVADILASHLQHQVIPLRTARPELPAPVAAWVMRLIELRPEDRFQSASQALDALGQAVSAPAAAPKFSLDAATRSARRYLPWAAIVFGVALLLLAWWLAFPGKKAAQAAPGAGTAASEQIYNPRDLAGLRARIGQRVSIEGRAVHSGKNKAMNARHLNFDDEGKALSLIFPLEQHGHFSSEAIEHYVGKRIRASGKVEENNGGLCIRIHNLDEVEILGE